mmetsp:Transcript_37156/g.27064  ORF Transcript_37156/g.27064 Transcript_37156/m.27064 type:complete len:83 (-) Transcript_37156:369-617(-)
MITGRNDFIACFDSTDSKIYAIGGFCFGKGLLDECEVYDLATDEWKQISPLSLKLKKASACVMGRNVYVFGGTDGFKNIDSI